MVKFYLVQFPPEGRSMFEERIKYRPAFCHCGLVMGHPDCHHSQAFLQDLLDRMEDLYERGGLMFAVTALLGEHSEDRVYTQDELNRAMVFAVRAKAINFSLTVPG